ncbi:MAG: phosphate acyltransferase PlsX [Oscillospiraceae bacterium]|nr:phosphate acyltransferase PlsX [Oscillospiraceae bacterium]
MRIIIDAMSGDKAPGEIVRGAVDAQREFGAEVLLVGQPEAIRACLADCGAAEGDGIQIFPASDIIDMHDDPSTAVRRKRDSSMAVALDLLVKGEGDAAISAGNTGALLTGATLYVKRIKGVRRAAMAPVLPNGGAGAMLIDCGANVECTPEYLLQFALMGSLYSRTILGCESPRVGLLNNGAEDTKGTPLCKETYALLKAAGEAGRINFIGNVEGSEVFSGGVDVIVTDGFTGNVLLKTVEGTAKYLMKNLKAALTSSTKAKLGAALVHKELSGLKKLLDVNEVGGTAFLGIRKPVIKAHGSSDARAIRSAVRQAVAFVNANVIGEIEANVDAMRLDAPTEKD